MSKLSEWVEQNTTLTQKKFDENDITTNVKIRKMFFDQVENLEFSSKRVEKAPSVFIVSENEFLISLRLDFPRKTEAPYTFLFNPDKLTIVPQYTATHRVYRPMSNEEKDILTNLGFYLESNERNRDKANPDNRRDRSKSFFERQGYVQNDVIMFPLYQEEEAADGVMVLKYIDENGTESIVAYQSNEPDFTVTQEFRQVRINRQVFSGEHNRGVHDESDCRSGIYFYVYNYPVGTNPGGYVLTARY